MADFKKAFDYLMSNETFKKNGKIVSRFEDPSTGEVSNWGISLKWLVTVDPEATADTVRAMTQDAAESLYSVHWWDKYKFVLIPSDAVAAKVFDAAVNSGPVTAIKIFQTTLNEPLEDQSARVAVDGVIGPQVSKAVAFDCKFDGGEYQLLAAFAVNLGDRYREIAAKHPALAKNLPTWEARAEKLPSLV